MKAKERVKRTINFTGPDKIPLRFAQDSEQSDMIAAGYAPASDWEPHTPGEDEFGYIWDDLGGNIVTSFGQVKYHPLEDWSDYDNYQLPDPDAAGRLQSLQTMIKKYPDKYISASLGISGFNRVTFIRGMENVFMDFYNNREKILDLIDRVFEWESRIIEKMVKLEGVDSIWLGDDWGTQESLMIAPDMWREIFKPRYQKQFALAKKYNKDVIFHTCGYVNDIIGDLIEIGADALNLNQPRLLDIDWLAEHYRGKVCFICPVDMQRTLIEGDEEDIKKEVKELISKLGTVKGGFIPCADEGLDHGYIPVEKIRLMGETFAENRALKVN